MAKRRPSGDGMVRKREDGRWEGRIVVGHKSNGDSIFRYLSAGSQKELLAKLHRNIEEYRDVDLREESKMPLGEWLDRWLEEYAAPSVRPSTLEGYRGYIERNIKPYMGNKPVSKITAEDIRQLYRELQEHGRQEEHPQFGYKLAGSTIRRIHGVLHEALDAAAQENLIAGNPTDGIVLPRKKAAPKQVLNDAQLERFMTAIQEDKVSGFCPGCMHSTVIKLIGEVLEEMDLVDRAACVLGIGCCGLHMDYIAYDNTTAPHGRACAVATGMKRSNPDSLVFTYQGDGDFASIGLAESISAANRGENITVIFINNGIYGMTGGQMAPTTLVGMKASTAPHGRDPKEHGYPMHMCEILNQLTAPAYLVRTSCNTPANVNKTKQAIHKAFQNQLDGKGFSMVEIVTSCPTNWGLDPMKSLEYIEEKMLPEFPLGVVRDR